MGFHPAQHLPDLELLVGGPGGLDQEPPDEREPDRAGEIAGQQEEDPADHQQPSDGLASTPLSRISMFQNSAYMISVGSAPTTAITNSSLGPRDSTLARVAPPNRNRVMSWTRMPRAWETSAWASSWPRTEPKNSTAARMAIPTAPPVDRLGYTRENRRYKL